MVEGLTGLTVEGLTAEELGLAAGAAACVVTWHAAVSRTAARTPDAAAQPRIEPHTVTPFLRTVAVSRLTASGAAATHIRSYPLRSRSSGPVTGIRSTSLEDARSEGRRQTWPPPLAECWRPYRSLATCSLARHVRFIPACASSPRALHPHVRFIPLLRDFGSAAPRFPAGVRRRGRFPRPAGPWSFSSVFSRLGRDAPDPRMSGLPNLDTVKTDGFAPVGSRAISAVCPAAHA